MPLRKMLPGQAMAALLFAAVASFAYETRPLVGLDLVEDHTAEMMESMKAGMSINFMEAALLQAVVPGGGDGAQGSGVVFPSYSLTDVDGVVHTCTVREEPEGPEKPASIKTAISTAVDPLEPLEGTCATLARGYWTYKWCHRKSVVQIHKDGGPTIMINLGAHKSTEVKLANANANASPINDESSKDAVLASDTPVASRVTDTNIKNEARALEKTDEELLKELDRKKASLVRRSKKRSILRKFRTSDLFQGINDFSEVAAVVDVFEGGDSCEETGGKRSLKTTITCCPMDYVDKYAEHTKLAVFVSIQEVSVCSYVAQVCTPLLCPEVTDETTHAREKEAADSSGMSVASVGHRFGVFGILQQLDACFPPKKDSWWSYKLCLSAGISQYHEELFQKTDGGLVAEVTDTFSLGKWDMSAVIGNGKDLIRPSEQGAGKGGTIVLEFTAGTECDLTGVLRSTTVHLKCGSVQHVREVVEDRTCHYRILAFSPLLCSHPALMPKKAAVRTVDCVPERKSRRKVSDLLEQYYRKQQL